MIRGIGVDMAEIRRFGESYARFGMRFPERILGDTELRDFGRARNPARFLAMRFAAKEATSKALGTGFKQGIAPRQVQVIHAPSGKPNLTVDGEAARLFERLGIAASHISLTDEGGFVVAFVVLETL
ncbi:MAG: holo-ACP synthase [Gammaproteobacteria bacterium]